MLTEIQYRILRKFWHGDAGKCSGSVYSGISKLRTQLGEELFTAILGKTVVDFGCGEGGDAVEMASAGANRVIGIDIREDVIRTATENAETAGVSAICKFGALVEEPVDVIVSLDAFEHFADPANVLEIMSGILRPGGEVFICFGPTWYHPYGGHLFSVFPWAHLLFSEKALIRWRSDFKTDGATRFCEVAGGLNQMTVRRFEQLVMRSAFGIASLVTVPIRPLRSLHNRITREFTTSAVRCRLVKRG